MERRQSILKANLSDPNEQIPAKDFRAFFEFLSVMYKPT